MALHDVLTNLGLTAKEAKIYLANLELGQARVSDIALRAKLNRVTAYDILKKLLQKGFVSTFIQKKVRYFAPMDPDTLRDDYRQKYNNFKTVLPDLRRLHGKTSHPRIRYYEGLEGIKKVYIDTLNAKTEILNYANSKTIRQYWPDYDREYVEERVKRKIYLRGIAPRDEWGEKVVAGNKTSHREIRLVPPSEFSFANEINIYDDKVAIISFGKDEILGMILESPEIADTQRAIFMMAWSSTEQTK